MSSRNVEDLVIPPMKFQKNAKRIKTSTINMGYHKISKLSNDSIVPMPQTRKWVQVIECTIFCQQENKD